MQTNETSTADIDSEGFRKPPKPKGKDRLRLAPDFGLESLGKITICFLNRVGMAFGGSGNNKNQGGVLGDPSGVGRDGLSTD